MLKVNAIFPPIETALELEPEELAVFVLRHLGMGLRMNRHNYTLSTQPEYIEYAGGQIEEFCRRLMEAWIWLEKEMFLAPRPASAGSDEFFITRRGNKVLEGHNFESYKKGHLLPSEGLDPILVRKVKPSFIGGDYDTAVLLAFKEVEIRVRDKAEYTTNEIGTSLMRKAFKSGSGPLADQSVEEGEQDAVCHLFAGAIGKFKNASSHRNVEYNDPNEVADIIHLANQLLRMRE